MGETGALNCMLYETEKSAVLVDCGVSFANDRQYPGVDVIVPDFDFLNKIKHKLKAVVLTHAHEDHIGALPYFLQKFKLPVYGTEFTRGVVQSKLVEFNLADADIRELHFNKPLTLDDFEILPIFVNHSMMDVAALLISSHDRKLLHLTDFKIDSSSPDGRVIDLAHFKNIGKAGLDVLLMDSTNALSPGWTASESVIRTNLIELFTQINGRILTCLFSSNTYRMQSLIECARVTGRKIALTGRSTKEYTRVALELNRLNTKGVDFYDVEEIDQFPDSEVLVIVTGSQAEPRSVLSRMARGMFRPLTIREGDTLVMSSKMIPGNEGRIIEMLDLVALQGAHVIIENRDRPIHASGHAKEDELREIFRLTKPRYFIPIHGSYLHLKRHAEIAVEEGIARDNCEVILNGDTVALGKDSLQRVCNQIIGRVFISENTNYQITPEAIKRRKKLAWNGLVVLSVLYDHQDGLLKDLNFFSEGIFGGDLETDIIEKLKKYMKPLIQDSMEMDREKIKKLLKVEIRHFFKDRYEIRPEVIVITHEV